MANKKKVSISNEYIQDKIQSYTENMELRNALEAFFEMRNNINKPITTQYALDMIFNKLDRYTNFDSVKIEILSNSIECNWQGVFPIKTTNQKPSSFNRKRSFESSSQGTGKELEKILLDKNDLDKF